MDPSLPEETYLLGCNANSKPIVLTQVIYCLLKTFLCRLPTQIRSPGWQASINMKPAFKIYVK